MRLLESPSSVELPLTVDNEGIPFSGYDDREWSRIETSMGRRYTCPVTA